MHRLEQNGIVRFQLSQTCFIVDTVYDMSCSRDVRDKPTDSSQILTADPVEFIQSVFVLCYRDTMGNSAAPRGNTIVVRFTLVTVAVFLIRSFRIDRACWWDYLAWMHQEDLLDLFVLVQVLDEGRRVPELAIMSLNLIVIRVRIEDVLRLIRLTVRLRIAEPSCSYGYR